ncbi:MAG: DUF4998 domain-containing protein [Bacteroidales bacterium]|nr:DUF4998 domain-containing protein [Bacteroidales bacterium]
MKYIFCILFILMSFLQACSDMTESMDEYLSKGEIIYIAKVDSAKTYSGNNRFMLSYWISDPRAKQLYIYWNQKVDSIIVDIPEHNANDSIILLLGDSNNKFAEGDYTLQIVSHDNKGNKSINYEIPVNVYGEAFLNSLRNKFIKSADINKNNNSVSITWGAINSSKELGVIIDYTDLSGSSVNIFKNSQELKSKTVLNDVNLDLPLVYKTAYKPEETAIDTFYTSPINIY